MAKLIASLSVQEERLRTRLGKLYLDKLDVEINQETYAELKAKFEAELDKVRPESAADKQVDRKYLD